MIKTILMIASLAAAFPATPQAQVKSANASGRGTAAVESSSRAVNPRVRAFGLTTDQRLIGFKSNAPQRARTIGPIQGLIDDTSLVGMDFRVQNGLLYGVGNLGGIYTIDTTSGVATFVNRLSIAMTGTSFGVDFNPAADRLRIISNDGQNLRHDVNVGGVTIADGRLNYVVGTDALGVVGAAYTNNDLDTNTATTLYTVDSTLHQVVLQSPANSGTLVATGKLTVDASADVGFDIFSTISSGVTVDVQAFASLVDSIGLASFYKVTLPTGKAELLGSFRAEDQVMDIAIPL
ncbi:MAG: DUF4394 domain-containing protein [Verrucomicrobiota bacterium]|nr:DUF4394 domain-containing protein [Verrucomicrobiota bacterium]MDQ3415379.1 DUF4394 domain-containing protein [Verrucomicrobiota bacterium]